MAEYIERETVRNAVRKNTLTKYDWSEEIDFEDFEKVLDGLTAADVAPVVHGRWKYYHKQNKAVCTNCSFERDLDANFGRAISCPNCWAKMDVTDINVGDKGGESHETKERGTEVS